MPCNGCKDTRPKDATKIAQEWDFYEALYRTLPRLASEPSCMECVEKHVSVAYVAAGEVYDGYEGVMKIIGNLRLAEEHSQEWPILHDAIRESRKNFQSKRTMPDWKNLGDLISQARHSFNPE